MKFNEVLRHYGSIINIAYAMQVSLPTVYGWKKNGIPYPRQCQIEIETKGKLKAKEVAK